MVYRGYDEFDEYDRPEMAERNTTRTPMRLTRAQGDSSLYLGVVGTNRNLDGDHPYIAEVKKDGDTMTSCHITPIAESDSNAIRNFENAARIRNESYELVDALYTKSPRRLGNHGIDHDKEHQYMSSIYPKLPDELEPMRSHYHDIERMDMTHVEPIESRIRIDVTDAASMSPDGVLSIRNDALENALGIKYSQLTPMPMPQDTDRNSYLLVGELDDGRNFALMAHTNDSIDKDFGPLYYNDRGGRSDDQGWLPYDQDITYVKAIEISPDTASALGQSVANNQSESVPEPVRDMLQDARWHDTPEVPAEFPVRGSVETGLVIDQSLVKMALGDDSPREAQHDHQAAMADEPHLTRAELDEPIQKAKEIAEQRSLFETISAPQLDGVSSRAGLATRLTGVVGTEPNTEIYVGGLNTGATIDNQDYNYIAEVKRDGDEIASCHITPVTTKDMYDIELAEFRSLDSHSHESYELVDGFYTQKEPASRFDTRTDIRDQYSDSVYPVAYKDDGTRITFDHQESPLHDDPVRDRIRIDVTDAVTQTESDTIRIDAKALEEAFGVQWCELTPIGEPSDLDKTLFVGKTDEDRGFAMEIREWDFEPDDYDHYDKEWARAIAWAQEISTDNVDRLAANPTGDYANRTVETIREELIGVTGVRMSMPISKTEDDRLLMDKSAINQMLGDESPCAEQRLHQQSMSVNAPTPAPQASEPAPKPEPKPEPVGPAKSLDTIRHDSASPKQTALDKEGFSF